MATPPQAVVLAGPNGSGKSTAASRLLPPGLTFVNADTIAQEISGEPGTPADVGAGRLLLARLEALEAAREDFAFETTLATKMLAARLEAWRRNGYQIHLVFFWLPSPDMAVARVQARVRAGGHDVPEPTVRRRYATGLRNFLRIYRPLADTWRVYANVDEAGPVPIARGSRTNLECVQSPELWDSLEREACA
jgi:predicted ABC-type ATPase